MNRKFNLPVYDGRNGTPKGAKWTIELKKGSRTYPPVSSCDPFSFDIFDKPYRLSPQEIRMSLSDAGRKALKERCLPCFVWCDDRRKYREEITFLNGVSLDYDEGVPEDWRTVLNDSRLSFQFAAFETVSSAAEKIRIRIVLPLKEACRIDDYPSAVRQAQDVFDGLLDSPSGRESADPARLWFLPCKGSSPYIHVIHTEPNEWFSPSKEREDGAVAPSGKDGKHQRLHGEKGSMQRRLGEFCGDDRGRLESFLSFLADRGKLFLSSRGYGIPQDDGREDISLKIDIAYPGDFRVYHFHENHTSQLETGRAYTAWYLAKSLYGGNILKMECEIREFLTGRTKSSVEEEPFFAHYPGSPFGDWRKDWTKGELDVFLRKLESSVVKNRHQVDYYDKTDIFFSLEFFKRCSVIRDLLVEKRSKVYGRCGAKLPDGTDISKMTGESLTNALREYAWGYIFYTDKNSLIKEDKFVSAPLTVIGKAIERSEPVQFNYGRFEKFCASMYRKDESLPSLSNVLVELGAKDSVFIRECLGVWLRSYFTMNRQSDSSVINLWLCSSTDSNRNAIDRGTGKTSFVSNLSKAFRLLEWAFESGCDTLEEAFCQINGVSSIDEEPDENSKHGRWLKNDPADLDESSIANLQSNDCAIVSSDEPIILMDDRIPLSEKVSASLRRFTSRSGYKIRKYYTQEYVQMYRQALLACSTNAIDFCKFSTKTERRDYPVNLVDAVLTTDERHLYRKYDLRRDSFKLLSFFASLICEASSNDSFLDLSNKAKEDAQRLRAAHAGLSAVADIIVAHVNELKIEHCKMAQEHPSINYGSFKYIINPSDSKLWRAVSRNVLNGASVNCAKNSIEWCMEEKAEYIYSCIFDSVEGEIEGYSPKGRYEREEGKGNMVWVPCSGVEAVPVSAKRDLPF